MTEETFEEIIVQQTFHFKSKFEAEKDMLKTVAYLVTNSKDVYEIDKGKLDYTASTTSFERVVALDKNGQDVHGSYKNSKLLESKYFNKALAGESVVFEPLYSRTMGRQLLLMATPIKFDKEVIGVLLGIQSADSLHSLLFPSFGGAGYSYVVNNEGNIIAKGVNENALVKTDNVFDILQNSTFYNSIDFDSFKKDLIDDRTGQIYFEHNGEKRILKYMPIHVNGWNMLSLVPEEIVTENAREITLVSTALSVFCIAVVAVLMFRIYKIQKRSLNQISEIAFVDELTKAPTLAKFKLDAARFISDHPNGNFLMVKFDVDKFKLINESLGNKVGDMVLINLAKALKYNTPGAYDRYAHLHDDEFLVLHIYETQNNIIETRDVFKEKFTELMGPDFEYFVRIVSGHYYMSLENCTDIDEAIEKANIAHRKAKEIGAEIMIYDESFIKEAVRKRDIENRMKAALQNEEFKVYLQPQYLLNTESIGGAEALVRWIPDNGDIVYPNDFIPIFERNGFIIQLDLYMFEQVCKIIRGWMDKGIEPVIVSVNFSRLHLSNTNFVHTLCDIADKYAVPHHLLVVEITENTIISNEEVLLSILPELHNHGFTLAMDDFGAGYSSLGLLKNIPVDVIKIDKSFFSKVKNQERSNAVLASVIRMAKDLKIHTIAEGVENVENVDILKSLGCDTVQGYYYAKPMPHESFKLS